ncbi:MAG: cyclic nucleotide-binding domain-containing protein [Candidatus Promineifilaceae bacterium]
MRSGALGKVYHGGEAIVQQGEMGSSMYVIQDGEVEVIRTQDGSTIQLAVLGRGEFFGEISLFGNEERSATVRAKGEARILTVDKKIFLRQIQSDLTLAFRVFETMAARIKEMNSRLAAANSQI